MGKNDIFKNNGNGNGYYRSTKGPRVWPWVLLLVLVVGTILGVVIYKAFGEDFFTSQKPVVIEPVAVEEVEEEVVIETDPRELLKDTNHLYLAKEYAYPTEQVRHWITGKEAYAGDKIAFLTFDDGPSPTNTRKILEVLAEKEAVGTFFLIGSSIDHVADAGDIINEVLEGGHGIALHSYTHDYGRLYPSSTADPERILEELNQLQDRIRNVTGRPQFRSSVFRYPGGHMSWRGTQEADTLLKEEGIEYIDWNAMNGDSEPTNRRPTDKEGLAAFVMDSLVYSPVKEVMVVLMHDAENKGLTVESLPLIIDILREEGYAFGILK